MRVRAFTLTELLVVLGTMMLLSAILFPVFSSAKAAAKRVNCVSNFHQVSLSSSLYFGDYDDKFMLSTYAPGTTGNSTNDRTWVQMALPYAKSFDLFTCPSDTTRRRVVRAFEPSGVPGDPYGRFYSASKRSNLGYNWLYMSPVVMQGGRWNSVPRLASSAADPSNTILFVDSVFDIEKGAPSGGGFHLVTPPCRYQVLSGRVVTDTFAVSSNETHFYTPEPGWSLTRESGGLYGHIWPWHENKANVARLDGSIRSLAPSAISLGCKIGPEWSGRIEDPSLYIWDLR